MPPVDSPRTVGAAITHRTGRVLAIQRFGDDRWSLPGGPIAGHDPVDWQLRQHVREATGFDVECAADVGECRVGSDRVLVIRCDIIGVGADITSRTRTMRWMDPDTALSLMPAYAPVMTAAVEALRSGYVVRSAPLGTVEQPRSRVRGFSQSLPVGADGTGGVQRSGDAVAVGVPVAGQQDAVETLEAVE